MISFFVFVVLLDRSRDLRRHRAQHPNRFFMRRHARVQQIFRRPIAMARCQCRNLAKMPDKRFIVLYQLIHHALRAAVLTALAGAVGLLLLATFGYARLFLAPLTALGASASRIAEGSREYPVEVGSTREGAQIAAAVARLQSGPAQRS